MEITMDKDLTLSWKRMPEWWGNPNLGLKCFGKQYPDGTKVYIFGLEGNKDEEHQITDFKFVIRHTHTGMFRPDTTSSELMDYLDYRYKKGILRHGRALESNEIEEFKRLYNR